MLPTLGQIGPFSVATYTVLIDLGLAAALATVYLRAPAGQASRWLDAALFAIVGAFTGARLLYVVIHGDYFFPHLVDIFKFWQGGLAWPGAVAGAFLGAGLYCRRRGLLLAPLLDAAALPIALLGLLGWAGCAASGCAYGFEVNPGQWPAWLTTYSPDLYGLSAPRFPTQIIGMAWGVVGLALVFILNARGVRRPAGALGMFALCLVALGMLGLSFTRADPAPRVSGLRLDVIGSALVLVGACSAWGWLARRAAPAGRESEAAEQRALEPAAPEGSANP